jgi:two-component system phosphate regulon sensor histidine kinase PhoR
MKRRSIGLIIGLMGFALLGVVVMQLYFLRQSYQMQSELFNRSVNEALNNVVAKVTKQDALNFLNAKTRETHKFKDAETFDKKSEISINGSKSIIGDALVIKKKQTKRERKLAVLRDSLKRMILHKKMDDDINGMIQQGSLNLRIRIEQYTDEFGEVHGRFIPEFVKTLGRPPD